MSRRILSAFLALVLVAGFAFVSKADVTGSFDIDIALDPQTNAFEAVVFDIDLQANLQVNVTLSGLTFGADLGFGTTGVEFAVLSLTTNLGALSVFDQFVFAPPFGCDSFPSTNSQCAGQFVGPIGSSNGSTVDNAVGFVKKRVEMELNIAGITLNNLAIFEDVDFPDIHGPDSDPGDHEHDHFTTSDLYDLSTSDNTIDNSVPTFGFGDVITLSGQTVSGISVTNITGICADTQTVNRIKKRSFAGEVNKYCAGNAGSANEETNEALLAFEVEKILIEGVELGGLTIDTELEFRPGLPVSADFDVSFSVAGLANVVVNASSSNITNLSLDPLTVVVAADNLTLSLVDNEGDLEFDQVSASFALTLNPNQNPASLSVLVITDRDTGLSFLQGTLTVSRSGLTLSSTTSWVDTNDDGELTWNTTTFSLSAEAGALNFGADLGYRGSGMFNGEVSLGIVF